MTSSHSFGSVFFAVSLWDEEEAVVQCGECLGLFAGENAELVRAAAQSKPSVIGSVLSKLRSTKTEQNLPSKAAFPERGRASTAPKRAPIDDASIDAELAALKKRLGN